MSFEPPEWAAAPTETFKLEVLKDGKIMEEIELNREGRVFFILGRQPDVVQIQADHGSISRKHAVLVFRDDGALMLRDLGSAQGSFLNKKKCKTDVYSRVYSGDMMQFGASTRKYIVSGPDSQLPPEYESENTVKFRQQLMLKTLKAEERKRKREEEEENSGASWGFGEDAEQVDSDHSDDDEKKDVALPDYIKNDANFDRKYKEKYVADVQEDEIKSEKDKETMEKIKKKEKKIQNMQEENKRIYMKENSQESGLTAGQSACVDRNDKNIAVLEEEIEKLVSTIKFKNTQRREQQEQKATAASNATAPSLGAKRRVADEEDLLDTTSQTADATTNWRMRKKLAKEQSAGTAVMSELDRVGAGQSLDYKQIKELLQKEEELLARLETEKKEKEAATNTVAESTGGVHDQDSSIDQIISSDREKERSSRLVRLVAELEASASKIRTLQQLLLAATPALASLTHKDSKSGDVATAATAAAKQSNSAPSSSSSSSSTSAITAVIAAKAAAAASAGGDGFAAAIHAYSAASNTSSQPSRSLPLEEFRAFVEKEEREAAEEEEKKRRLAKIEDEEKKKKEADEKKKNEEGEQQKAGRKEKEKEQIQKAKLDAAAAAATKTAAEASIKAPATSNATSNPSANGAKMKVYSAPKGPTPLAPPSLPANTRASDILEGGDLVWVKPAGQTGDGKSALNAKFGY